MEKEILNKIEIWKKSLLDMTKRNSLISFKSPPRTSIEIIDEIPSEIFNQLVINEEKFGFLKKEIPKEINTNVELSKTNQDEKLDFLNKDIFYEKEFFSYNKENLDDKHTDNFLQTNLDKENLIKNLKSIDHKAKLVINEQGYNNLFLSLGMLEWYESTSSSKKIRSPLILVPVELVKKSIKMQYGLVRSNEEPLLNISLQQKFKEDFGIKIPDLEIADSFNPQNYISDVQKLIEEMKKWKVTNNIHLSFFSFANFVMYKDLESHLNQYKSNPIIQALSGVNQAFDDISYPDSIEKKDLDLKRHPKDIYHVMDADSSQDEAIEITKSGRNLVIKGPPGTGKSQTIANIIADAIGNKKSVLFVSQKIAALDVVYDRLKNVGLGEFCLEIHSRSSNKKHILEQIQNAFDFEINKIPNEKYLNELKEKRDKLNKYVEFIHKPVDQIGKSTYWLLGQLNTLRNIEIIDFNKKDLNNLQMRDFENIVDILETITDRINQIGIPKNHPFYGTKINDTSELHQQQLSKSIDEFIDIFLKFLKDIKKLENIFSIEISTTKNLKDYFNLIDILSVKHKIPLSILNIHNINIHYNNLKPYLKNINVIQKLQKKSIFKYENDILSEDLKLIKRDLKGKFSSVNRYFKPSYYKTVNIIKSYSKKKISIFKYSLLLDDINDLVKYNKLVKKVNEIDLSLTNNLGVLWNGIDTDTKTIDLSIEWLIKFYKHIVKDNDINSFRNLIEDSNNMSEEIKQIKFDLDELSQFFPNKLKKIEESLNIDKSIIYNDDFDNTNFIFLKEKLYLWKKNIENLTDWVRYRKAYEKCASVGLESYIDQELSSDEDININDIVLKYKKIYYYTVFEKIKSKNQILNDFESLIHEKLVEGFKDLDYKHIEFSKYRIQKNLVENKPNKNYTGSKSSELGILQKQFRLKRGHMSPRKLFSKAQQTIQNICPCFMMSPMSVSQYINPDNLKFDLVIFDEASQIKPEHSVGPIIRGKQLIVVGDEKQLPPTSFFEREIFLESEDDVLLPSILDEALTLSCFKESDLRWHYRSKNESLIHFSNERFYNSRLNTFPNNIINNSDSGLELIHIKNSVYDRGGSQTNKAEAEAVVEEIINHYKKNSELSLGIVALSMKQRQLITDLLDAKIFENPVYEKLIYNSNYKENMFIKNLETVQGDERDIILISIAYGKDASGRLHMNFGPINKNEGWRRLNVLITRARVKIKVFSSIISSDFDLSKISNNLGVQRLKEYLEYAESGGSINLGQEELYGEMDVDNPFETSVAEQLKQEGIKFNPQVGQSGYKIDFGILDPNDSSKYILALECDGATYHSSSTARDRDRLRQSVLESNGWRFHRIWSTDWFQNPKREIERLKDSIFKANRHTFKKKIDSSNEFVFDKFEKPRSTNSDIKILKYEKYKHWSDVKSPEEFYQKADSTNFSNKKFFNQLILEILKKESPIHQNELTLRIIELYDMRSVGAKIKRIMDKKIGTLVYSKEIKKDGDFIFYKNQTLDFVRTRNNSDSVDKITLIAPIELQNCIKYILDNELKIPKNELIVQVSKLLGYKNTGPRIQTYVGEIIDDSIGKFLKIKEGSEDELEYIK